MAASTQKRWLHAGGHVQCVHKERTGLVVPLETYAAVEACASRCMRAQAHCTRISVCVFECTHAVLGRSADSSKGVVPLRVHR